MILWAASKTVGEPPAGWRDQIISLADGVERVRQPLGRGKRDHRFAVHCIEGIRVPARAVAHCNPVPHRIIGECGP